MATPDDDEQPHTSTNTNTNTIRTSDLGFIPIPPWLRYDPADDSPSPFWLNYVFGLASTFIVANLYYCQPLLIQFSQSFDVEYKQVANIPTLVQGGYAAGILLISPLGDLVRRRPLILLLTLLSTALTLALALTHTLRAFESLTFLTGLASVAPQILIPLAADLAPPARRASALAVVISAILLGVLAARVLAGAVAQFAQWRAVYYAAAGVQAGVGVACFFAIPDYPAKRDPAEPHPTYAGILWSMARFAVTEPLLVQSCLINFCSTACFSNFWVTLTFLLDGPPYNYSTLAIGLFGLLGMLGVALGPPLGRLIDRLVPWYATLLSLALLLLFQAVHVAAGGTHVAAVVVACLGLDVFRQTQQVSLSTAVFGISAAARSRLNAVLILSFFLGQIMGSAAGAKLFIAHGWRANAGWAMALYALELLFLAARGPHCARATWVGWHGGWEARAWVVEARRVQKEKEEKEEERARARVAVVAVVEGQKKDITKLEEGS